MSFLIMVVAFIIGNALFNLVEKYLPGLRPESPKEVERRKKAVTNYYYNYAMEHPKDQISKPLLEVLNKKYVSKS